MTVEERERVENFDRLAAQDGPAEHGAWGAGKFDVQLLFDDIDDFVDDQAKAVIAPLEQQRGQHTRALTCKAPAFDVD